MNLWERFINLFTKRAPKSETIPPSASSTAPIPISETIPAPAPTPPHVSLIPLWAQGIFQAEGGVKAAGYSRNNPGDIRYFPPNDYVASLGAIADSDGWAVFRTMQAGIKACEQLCRDAANGLLPKDYPAGCTVAQFCQIYTADKNSSIELTDYINIVCSRIQRSSDTKISTLL